MRKLLKYNIIHSGTPVAHSRHMASAMKLVFHSILLFALLFLNVSLASATPATVADFKFELINLNLMPITPFDFVSGSSGGGPMLPRSFPPALAEHQEK